MQNEITYLEPALFIISLFTLVTTILAIFIARNALKHQRIAMLYAMLHEKSKEAEGYLNKEAMALFPKKDWEVIGILICIKHAKDIIDLAFCNKKGNIVYKKEVEIAIEVFFLDLPAAITLKLKQVHKQESKFKFEGPIEIEFDKLAKDVLLFLQPTIEKNLTRIKKQNHSR